jgi:hypothetical protein
MSQLLAGSPLVMRNTSAERKAGSTHIQADNEYPLDGGGKLVSPTSLVSATIATFFDKEQSE